LQSSFNKEDSSKIIKVWNPPFLIAFIIVSGLVIIFMKAAKLFGQSAKYGYSIIKGEIAFTQAFKTVRLFLLRPWARNWLKRDFRSFFAWRSHRAVRIG
jgi:hypothetical protein